MEIEDIILRADEIDDSGLVFPKDILIQAVRDYNERPDLKVGRISSKDTGLNFELHQVTHKIIDLSYDDPSNCVKSTIELLDTAASKIVYSDPYGYFLEPILIAHTDDGSNVATKAEIIRVDIVHRPKDATNKFIDD
jgi:hypothetical protein